MVVSFWKKKAKQKKYLLYYAYDNMEEYRKQEMNKTENFTVLGSVTRKCIFDSLFLFTYTVIN